MREMDHRVKNLFTLAVGVVSLSARSATSAKGLAADVRERLIALSKAHTLTLTKRPDDAVRTEQATTLHTLIRTIASRYEEERAESRARVAIEGPDVALAGGVVTSFALLQHEFATNAAKYGALSTSDGEIHIRCSEVGDQFRLIWTERGGPRVNRQTDGEGFGSLLSRSTVQSQLAGAIERDWDPEGLTIRLTVARDRLARPQQS